MLLQAPPVAAIDTPAPSGLVHTASSSPLLGPRAQGLSCRPCRSSGHRSQAGAQGSSTPVCAGVFCLPQMGVVLSSEPLKLPFCPRRSEGASQDVGTPPLFSSLPGAHVPSLHPLFFSFILRDDLEIFSCPLSCLMSPAPVQ